MELVLVGILFSCYFCKWNSMGVYLLISMLVEGIIWSVLPGYQMTKSNKRDMKAERTDMTNSIQK